MKIKSKKTENIDPNQIQKIQAGIHTRNFGKDLKQVQSDHLTKTKLQDLVKSRIKKVQQNPLSEYEISIIERILYLENNEPGFKINHSYVKIHNLLNNKMRVFLVKYLYKIFVKMNLKRTTLHLAVFYMDNYFQKTKIYSQSDLIIICQASMHIAMKYEQIYPPELSQWAGVKNKNAIYAAQAQILKQLDFKLAYFTVQHFRQYLYKKAMKTTLKQQYFKLLTDLTLFDAEFYKFKASQLSIVIKNIVTGNNKIKQSKKTAQFQLQLTEKIRELLNNAIFEWIFLNFQGIKSFKISLQQSIRHIVHEIQTFLRVK